VTHALISKLPAPARSDIALVLIMLGVAFAPHFMNDAARAQQARHAWIAPDRQTPGADEIRHGAIHIFL
jgi:hypothetical protein